MSSLPPSVILLFVVLAVVAVVLRMRKRGLRKRRLDALTTRRPVESRTFWGVPPRSRRRQDEFAPTAYLLPGVSGRWADSYPSAMTPTRSEADLTPVPADFSPSPSCANDSSSTDHRP